MILRDTVPTDRDEHPRSPCYDDLRFISKDPGLAAEAVEICGGCEFRACVPVLRQIMRSPTSRSTLEGVWDGKHYTENTTGRRAPAERPPVPINIEGRVTHCHRGHEMDEKNAYWSAQGKRNCRACQRDARRRYKDRQKGDAA